MLRLALKGVLAHKVRLAMTAVAIVLGVAFVSGTYVFTDSIKASFGDLFGDVNSGVDLYVSGVSEFGLSTPLIDEGLVDQVAALPGVVIAAPSVEGIAQIIAPPPCEKGPDADSPNRVLSVAMDHQRSASPTFPTARISHHLR